MDCGNGNLAHQNSIRSQETLTVSSVSVKTLTARCSLAGTVEFTVSLMAKPSRIQSLEEWARSGAEGCFATGTVVCGSELSTKGLYTYTMEGQMCMDCRRVSQAKLVPYSLRIAKAISGWEPGAASIAFATLRLLRFP